MKKLLCILTISLPFALSAQVDVTFNAAVSLSTNANAGWKWAYQEAAPTYQRFVTNVTATATNVVDQGAWPTFANWRQAQMSTVATKIAESAGLSYYAQNSEKKSARDDHVSVRAIMQDSSDAEVQELAKIVAAWRKDPAPWRNVLLLQQAK